MIASRVVTAALHEQFALLTGDRNPMHMDAVAARRTPAGLPVVHGVHTLLWALESLAASGRLIAPLARVRAKFIKWVYLGDQTILRSPSPDPTDPPHLQIDVCGMLVCSVELTYGPLSPLNDTAFFPSPIAPGSSAVNLSFADLPGRAGHAFTADYVDAERSFPRLAAKIGAAAVAEIAACSYIVGMELPGLHSMFSRLDANFSDPSLSKRPTAARPALQYQVTHADERFSKAKMTVRGASITGNLEVFMRDPPVQQPTMHAVASRVTPQEFAGMRALVIGGSRGLGELTAKLIAAGGGQPTITYAMGHAEAERIAAEIHSAGAFARTMSYDVCREPAAQLNLHDTVPTHLFYFATGTIYKPKPGVLSAPVLADFIQFYVKGFYDLCMALLDMRQADGERPQKLSVFYPSSIFVEQRPAGMTEYAMAKAAGEQLCIDMNTHLPGIQIMVPRLPKLYTDQTQGVLPEREIDTIETLLPLIRRVASPTVTT